MKHRTRAVLGTVLLASASLTAHAEDSSPADPGSKPSLEVVVGPFAVHRSNEDQHEHVVLLGLERGEADGTLWGFDVFRNSFGQPSAYAYYGHEWDDLFSHPALYVKLSAGVIYGYKGKYKDKVPFNHHGFGLGIIPAFGYRLGSKDAVQVGLLGTAALIFTYNHRF